MNWAIGLSLANNGFGLINLQTNFGCSDAELTTQFSLLELHILCTTSQQQSRMPTLPRDQY